MVRRRRVPKESKKGPGAAQRGAATVADAGKTKVHEFRLKGLAGRVLCRVPPGAGAGQGAVFEFPEREVRDSDSNRGVLRKASRRAPGALLPRT